MRTSRKTSRCDETRNTRFTNGIQMVRHRRHTVPNCIVLCRANFHTHPTAVCAGEIVVVNFPCHGRHTDTTRTVQYVTCEVCRFFGGPNRLEKTHEISKLVRRQVRLPRCVEGLYPTPHIHEQMTAYIMATSTATLSTTR